MTRVARLLIVFNNTSPDTDVQKIVDKFHGVLHTKFDVYDMIYLIYEKATLFCGKALFVASACYHTPPSWQKFVSTRIYSLVVEHLHTWDAF